MADSIDISTKSCCQCFPPDACKAPPELDPKGFLHSCRCGAKLCAICIGDKSRDEILCRGCHVSGVGTIGSTGPSTSVVRKEKMYSNCKQCCRRILPEDSVGSTNGICPRCRKEAPSNCNLVLSKAQAIDSVPIRSAAGVEHDETLAPNECNMEEDSIEVATDAGLISSGKISEPPESFPTLLDCNVDRAIKADALDSLACNTCDSPNDDAPTAADELEKFRVSEESVKTVNDSCVSTERNTHLNDTNPAPMGFAVGAEVNTRPTTPLDISSIMEIRNYDAIRALKSNQSSISIQAKGWIHGEGSLVYSQIPNNFLENIRHVRPTPNEGHGSRYYLCKHWFGEQNEQRYTSIECHGFVCKKYRRNTKVLVLGLCGMRTTLSQDEQLQYVLCSAVIGNCGRTYYYIYSVTAGTIEKWSELIRTVDGMKMEYYCDVTIPFNTELVKTAYLIDRDRAGNGDPLFDPERWEKRHGPGSAAFFRVQSVRFDIDPAKLPVRNPLATHSGGRLTRSTSNVTPPAQNRSTTSGTSTRIAFDTKKATAAKNNSSQKRSTTPARANVPAARAKRITTARTSSRLTQMVEPSNRIPSINSRPNSTASNIDADANSDLENLSAGGYEQAEPIDDDIGVLPDNNIAIGRTATATHASQGPERTRPVQVLKATRFEGDKENIHSNKRICLAGVREEGDYIYKGILEYKKLSEVFNEAVDTNKCARNHERWSSSSIGNSVPVGKNVYEEMLFQSLLKERENNSLFLQQLVRDRLQSTVVSGVSALSTDEVETSSSHFRPKSEPMLTHVMKPTYVDEEPMFEEDPTFEELVEEPADMFEHEYVTQPSRRQNYVPVPDEGPRFVYQESARPRDALQACGHRGRQYWATYENPMMQQVNFQPVMQQVTYQQPPSMMPRRVIYRQHPQQQQFRRVQRGRMAHYNN